MLLVLFRRFLGKTGSRTSKAGERKETPEDAVSRIREGDPDARDAFITAYQPYVAKVASRFCKRYVDPTRDDEYAIALLAFNEAIDQYAAGAGRSFLGFAETVIRRRLIDHLRKEQRHTLSMPLSAFDSPSDEEFALNPVETRAALEQHDRQLQAEERRFEIEAFSEVLKAFGITFAELADQSPKHADSRLMLTGIGRQIAESPELFAWLNAKKQLPIKELLAVAPVSRKTLERNRKFLIATALIHRGHYPHLQDYLRLPDERRTNEEGVGP